MAERTFDLLAGAPRAGKSSFSAKVMRAYPENAIIVKHTANINDATFSFLTEKTTDNWRQGVPKNGYAKCKMAFKDRKKDYPAFLQWVIDHFRNGLLVIDDATIFERDRLTEGMNEIVSMRAHLGIDIMLIYHGFTLMPIEQFIFCNHLIIFNTTDNLEYKKSKIPFFKEVVAATHTARQRFRLHLPQDPHRYVPEIVKLS
jgi:hypothetical protein